MVIYAADIDEKIESLNPNKFVLKAQITLGKRKAGEAVINNIDELKEAKFC